MNLHLVRDQLTMYSTSGQLYIGEEWECYTLEDVVRAMKIPEQTAIPAGTYQVIVNYSSRFKRLMPRLLDVPGFEGILIHPGNTVEDTSGCILVGRVRSPGWVGESRVAFAQLFTKIQDALTSEEVYIKIDEGEAL